MKIFSLRVLYKLLRKLPWADDIHLDIQAGPIKGLKFNVVVGNPYMLGTYELDSLNLLLEQIGPNDVVYDLGANAGYYTLALAKKTKNTVYAFEPLPANIEKLEKHLSINKVENVSIMDFALSDSSGQIEFSNISSPVGNTYVKSSQHFQKSSSVISVKTETIDGLVFGAHQLPAPSVIKIDVEGAEYDVLKGATRTIEKFKPKLMLATHDAHLKGVKDDCLKYLLAYGYRITPTDTDKKHKLLEDFLALPSE